MAAPAETVARLRTADLEDREHCRLPPAVLDALDLEVGRQVRLRRGDQCSLHTVVGTADAVEVTQVGEALLDGDGPVEVSPDLVVRPLDPPRGTFRESLDVGGDHLVTCAPHGGEIEPGTHEQATALADRLGGTTWSCLGRWPGGGAFFRWHVTANDLHPASFPRLGEVAERGFDHAVAFHAWRREGIGVGGGAPRSLRVAVRDALRAALDGAVEVELATDARYAGEAPENVVNWLTDDGAGGIQLEQGLAARTTHREAVVEALASVLASRIERPLGR